LLILLVPVPSLSTCKMIVSKRKWRKSGAARTLLRPVPLRSSVAHHACRKRLFSLNKFSLCLSRACLGKMIVLYINCSKEVRFSRRNPPRNHLGCSVVAIRGGNARLAPQLPLRVTGACLGKFKRSAFHRLAEKCNSSRLSHLKHDANRSDPCVMQGCTKRLLFQLFLCSSRACLGKNLIFSIERLQRRRFSHRALAA
jgi:hypothetical protein